MHISEGVLSGPVLVGGAVIAATGLALSLRRLPWEQLMSVAVVSSAFFVASLVHIPIGVASVHLIMNGLIGAILGWAAFPAIAVALFLQALLFQFGGLAVLGVNICVMGIPAVLCGVFFRPFLSQPKVRPVAAFLCGSLSVALSAAFFALALTLSGEQFTTAALSVLTAHIPIMLIEGIITVIIVSFISKRVPLLLQAPSGRHDES